MATIASKLALVIGIGKYDSLKSLSNSENDATDMTSALKSIDFTVTTAVDLKRVALKRILADFEDSIQLGDMVLFYFAGHGIQWEDQNYLLPKDTPKMDKVSLNRSAINAQDILNTLTDRNPFVTIFLLDCCRNYHLRNPELDESSRDPNYSSSAEFKPMQKAGALIAFACAPGAIAIGGVQQRNGLFTKHLLQHITTPNEDIGLILRTVREGVVNESKNKQIPFLNDGLFKKNIFLNRQPIANSEKVYDFKQLSYKDLQIQEEIGRGAFGIVYKAKWLTTRSIVAVKILHLTNMAEKIKNTFLKEVSLLQRVRCPQIVSFYGACIEEEKYALVMEYMSLGSLYKILHEDNISLTWDERLSIALQAAIGINYLHQLPEPILHRDIKSLNLLLERAYNGYTLKLCDFGVARTRNETARQATSNRILVITLQWTAPEILRLERYTDKSDIYSLGVVYWELAACKIPYDEYDDGVIRAFVLAGDRLQITEDTPSMFRIVIEQCWAQKPSDRPASSDLIQMIEECMAEQDTPVQPVTVSKVKSSKKSQLRLNSSSLLSTPVIQSSSNRVLPNIPENSRWKQKGVTVAGGNGSGGDTNQLCGPFGLFVDFDETVVIADYWNHRIIQWKKDDTNGQVIAGGNGKGNRLDQLNQPTDVLIDEKSDSLIIADRGNERVVRWSRRNGTKQGEILIDKIDCFGLAIDDHSHLYVSDTGKNEVKRYRLGEKNGTVVAGGNGDGNRLDQLSKPSYLYVDRQQNVYISDNDNHRVMKWKKGAEEGIVVAGGQGVGDASTQFEFPYGIFVDTFGVIYVADFLNSRVMRWSQGNNQGTVIVGGNGQGAQANQFHYFSGLSFDRYGNLYVADYWNYRVQRFDIK